MKYRLDRVAKSVEPREDAINRYDFGKIALRDIAPFFAGAKTVYNDEIRATFLIETRREHGPDELAPARNHEHWPTPESAG